jgi:hypothetical protein
VASDSSSRSGEVDDRLVKSSPVLFRTNAACQCVHTFLGKPEAGKLYGKGWLVTRAMRS